MPIWVVIIICVGTAAIVTAGIFLLRQYLHSLVDSRIAAYQNDLMAKHIDEVQNIYREIRGWRHDYHNHIQIMKAYRSLEENERIDDYLDSLDADLTNVDKLIISGNVMADAILNSKLSLAKARGIDVIATTAVPPNFSISEIDLCVIIGNLLDNAIEACMRQSHGARFIRVYMDIKKDSLYISITNTATAAAKQNGRYISSKGGSHGFGLLRVDRLVGKYNGYIKRRDEQGAFTTEVLLPL